MNATTHDQALPAIPALARVQGVEECAAVIKGVRCRYQRAGTGPALLLVHGFMAYSFSWRFIIPELARHFSVYAVDLPGCGFSDRSDTLPATLASDAEYLLNLMDHLAVERFDVLGTSRGGGLAIALAGLAAERGDLRRIGRLVLSAPINPWSRSWRLRIRFLRTPAGRIYVVHLAKRLPFIRDSIFRSLYADPNGIPHDSLAGYSAGFEPAGSYEHVWNMLRSWMTDLERIASLLPTIASIPALLLWGSGDSAVDAASAEEMHRRWKNSAVLIMDGVGHMPYEEVPQQFVRIVLDFLLRETPATASQIESSAVMAHVAAESGRA